MTTFSIQIDGQVFVYVRGLLVMKRWLHTGESVTFHTVPAGTHWSSHT